MLHEVPASHCSSSWQCEDSHFRTHHVTMSDLQSDAVKHSCRLQAVPPSNRAVCSCPTQLQCPLWSDMAQQPPASPEMSPARRLHTPSCTHQTSVRVQICPGESCTLMWSRVSAALPCTAVPCDLTVQHLLP